MAVLLLGLVACSPRPTTPDETNLTAQLVSAVGERRYIEGRVPGGFRFGPRASRLRSGAGSASDSPAVLSVLAAAEASPSRHTPEGLLARGVARLLTGRVDQAIPLISMSAAAQPQAATWTALSAAYLEAAGTRTETALELSARAYDAAERAVAMDARLAEAWFNRAAAATHLPPCDIGVGAWDEYVTRESAGDWRDEGRRLKLEAVRACDRARDVDRLPGHQRTRLEETLLPSWARSLAAGHSPEADRLLAEAGRTAAGVTAATSDPFASDMVNTITRTDAAGRRRLAVAWSQYGRSRELFELSLDTDAEAAARVARRASRPHDGPLWLLIELQLGTMALQRRDLEVAAAKADQVFRAAGLRGYAGAGARARIVRALVRTQQGRLSDAARENREAGEVLERLHEPDLAAAAYGSLTSGMRRLNDARGIWSALANTLRVVDGVRHLRRRYVVLYNASLVAQSSGVIRTALRYQSGAVDAAERRGVAAAIVEAYTRRAQLRERLQSGSGAPDLELARQRVRDVSDEGRVRYYTALIDAVEGDSLLDPQPAAARDRFGRALDFFRTYEPAEVPRLYLGRGRASQRVGDLAAARADFLAGITAFETGRLQVGAENRVAYFDAARELFDGMVALSQDDPDVAFAFAERGRALTVVEALGGAVETATNRIAAQLPPDTALVQYATLPQRVLTWVITREGSHATSVAEPRASLEARVRSLLAAITDEKGAADVTTQAEALYAVLFAPIERHLVSARHLVIVGDGPIHRVPFALLQAGGRPLVERFTIVNALSASAFLAAERRGNGAVGEGRALVVGNPSYDRAAFEGLRPLPSAEREAAAVAAMYSRHTLLRRQEATRSRFLASAADSSVIHFGGHAVIDDEWPDRSTLLLAAGDPAGATLSAPEIAHLNLRRAPVVVLAACSTATGAAYRLEGATSLSRSFLIAGASSVVGTLWDIEDEVSEAFFTRFHQRLAAGETPAFALRAAQLDLLRTSRTRPAPARAWAAFQLIGALSHPPAA